MTFQLVEREIMVKRQDTYTVYKRTYVYMLANGKLMTFNPDSIQDGPLSVHNSESRGSKRNFHLCNGNIHLLGCCEWCCQP